MDRPRYLLQKHIPKYNLSFLPGYYKSNYLNPQKGLWPLKQLLANQTSEATSKKLKESNSSSLLSVII